MCRHPTYPRDQQPHGRKRDDQPKEYAQAEPMRAHPKGRDNADNADTPRR